MGFNFKKKYGQNFLTDKNLLDSIVSLSGVTKETTVLEIGPGAGALTSAIARQADRVVSFEIDHDLEIVLAENLKEYSNTKIVFKDFMKASNEEIESEIGTKDYIVIANLPYYITTPILFRFFEMENKPRSLTIMVQKEYGERMTANAGDSEYSSLSVLTHWLGNAKIVKKVPRYMFTPAPKVDSCIVHFVFGENKYDKEIAAFIRSCFLMRRKTLVNNISSAFDISKDDAKKILEKNQLNSGVRAEDLSAEVILKLYEDVKNVLNV